jgi:uncharacterized protein (DUF58 family)
MPANDPFPGVHVTVADLVALRGQAHGFSFLPRQPMNSLLAGRFASRLRGRGLNFEEIRRYQPGDDVRQIDWKVTARTRKAHSRVYTEERERPILLVVDQRISMFFGSVARMKSVSAAEAAALAAWRALGAKDRVGAVVLDDREARVIRPHRSRATVLRILGLIAQKNQALHAGDDIEPGPAMLNEALRHAVRLLPHDGLVLVITDGVGADDETQRLGTEIDRHNDAVVVFVHDPGEASLPGVNRRLVVTDGRLQLEGDLGDAATRARFAEDFASRLEQAKRFLLGRQVPLLPLRTDESTAHQLARHLGAGGPAREAK